MSKGHIITGLDIGSGTIKILSAIKKPKGENFEVLSQNTEVSAGVRRGVVIDVARVAEIINSLIKRAQDDIGRKVNSVYASVGGSHIFCAPSHGTVSVSRADQKISEEDIARVIQAAQTFSLPLNKEILDVFPKEFIIDGEKGVKEPLGLQGVRLEVDALALGAFSPYLKNLTQVILNSGLQINDLTFASIAGARAVLTPREKELGVVLLDIGAGTTGMAVFEEGNLIHLITFPIGSANITNDIAICLKTDIDTAEKIKLEFGTCLPFSGKKRPAEKHIKIEREEPLNFSRKALVEIITARVSEIFEEVNKELKKISRKELLPAGIVLTGGGSNILKIKDFCKKELKLPCRIGKPQGFSSLQDDPSLSTVCGLILKGADIEEGAEFSTPGEGILGKLKKFFRIFIP